jgi:hypothetical protein
MMASKQRCIYLILIDYTIYINPLQTGKDIAKKSQIFLMSQFQFKSEKLWAQYYQIFSNIPRTKYQFAPHEIAGSVTASHEHVVLRG